MNVSLRNAAKEPLFQFIVIGLLLIVGERLVNSSNYSGEYQIIVDDQVLAQFMQQQAKTFEPDQALAGLTALSGDDRQRLIDDYVRGEVLYREALALDLDRNDSIIRRRLMQKMDYLAQGFYDEVAPLNEKDLKRFYAEHRGEYKKSATATFTHVFISKENRGSQESKIAADTLLNSLNQDSIPFDKAGLYGERFLYNRNYVKRDAQEIASHFGPDFNQQLFDLEPSLQGNWQGPIESNYGWHLVLLTSKVDAYIPSLTDIGGVVLADAQRQQQHELKRMAINKLMAKYQIIDPDNSE